MSMTYSSGHQLESGGRFITSSSSLAYRNYSEYREDVDDCRYIVSPGVSLRDDILLIESDNSRSESSVVGNEFSPSSQTPPASPHQDKIASALGFKHNKRVLNYKRDDRSSEIEEIVPSHIKPIKEKPCKIILASSILQAPGLRNDFYCNLVSWSTKEIKVAVGLERNVYLWEAENNVETVRVKSLHLVTSVSCSFHEYLAVAYSDGSLCLVNQVENVLVDTYRSKGCFYCMEWLTDSMVLFAGDEAGQVYIFQVENKKLVVKKVFRSHKQQICGIALNKDFSQVAIGGNDNYVSIWDLSQPFDPQLKFILRHNAAVKALTYCPWAKSLLATGGGSKDRSIRFWHTNSGTLLREHKTSAQITSLVWSVYSKQIAATFGFGTGGKSVMIYVYEYPKMTRLLEVPATSSDLRILSSTISPDNCSLCVATNDSTIRIYRLWNVSHRLIEADSNGVGDYGSQLIQLNEGITERLDGIR